LLIKLQLSDQNNKWKGCPCAKSDTVSDATLSLDRFIAAQQALKNIPLRNNNGGKGQAGCRGFTVNSIPKKLHTVGGDINTNDLLWKLRESTTQIYAQK
jgi:hypothetical protein